VPLKAIVEARDLDGQIQFLQWLHTNIESRPAFVDAISIRAYDRALVALLERDVATFRSRLELSAETDSDPEFRSVVSAVRSFNQGAISRIMYEMSEHPRVQELRRDEPRLFANFMFRVIGLFATSDMAHQIGPQEVPYHLQQAMEIAWEYFQQQ